MSPAALVAKGAELLAKVPPDVLVHAVDFVEALVTGNAKQASRAATSALVSRFWRRARG